MRFLASCLLPPATERPAHAARVRCRPTLRRLWHRMRRGALPLAAGVLVVALLADCAPGSLLPHAAGLPGAGNSREAARSQPAGPAGAPAASSVPGPAAADRQGMAAPLPDAASVDRLIVKTGVMTVQVSNLAGAMAQIDGIVAAIPGAYIASATTSYYAPVAPAAPPTGAGKAGAPAARQVLPVPPGPTPPAGSGALLVLKVPAESFNDAVQHLRDLGTPLYESLGTQEVTEEYVDLAAQVRNLEATEQQYLSLLGRAQRIDEILQIQQRLTDVQGQIERLKGRLQLLQRRSAMATISLTLVLPSASTQVAGEARAMRTLRAAWAALLAVLERALDLVIYVAVFALPLLPPAAGLWWWRRSRRPLASAGGAV